MSTKKYHYEYNKARDVDRIAKGLCVRCGHTPSTEGKQTCDECRQRVKQYNKRQRENQQASQRDRRQRLLDSGLCMRCGKNPKDGELKYCRSCLDKQSSDLKVKREQNPEHSRQQSKKSAARLRADVIGHYGGKCACCSETTDIFLCLDHIEGGGNKHRKSLGSKGGRHFYRWIRSSGYPDGYRVLCWNCNHAFARLGYCPHGNTHKGFTA